MSKLQIAIAYTALAAVSGLAVWDINKGSNVGRSLEVGDCAAFVIGGNEFTGPEYGPLHRVIRKGQYGYLMERNSQYLSDRYLYFSETTIMHKLPCDNWGKEE